MIRKDRQSKEGRIWHFLKAGLILAIFCAIASVSSAEDEGKPILVNGDTVEFYKDERKAVGTGNVRIDYEGTRLTCDRITVYTETKTGVAEGNVVIVRGGNVLRGDKVTYNFVTKEGQIIDTKVESPPWFGAAENADLTPSKHLLSRGYVTTSDFDKPEYRIQARQIAIYPNRKVVAKHALFFIHNYPVLYLPYYVQPLDRHMGVRVTPGHDKEWGYFALTTIREDLSDNVKAKIHLDYRERKDLAWGIDCKYTSDQIGEGLLRTYYMNERSLQVNHLWSERTAPTIEQERFRVQYRHKWVIDPQTYLIGQYQRVSDPELLKDYFEREQEEDKTPQTFVALTNTGSYYALNAQVYKRVNRFYGETQKLPSVSLSLLNVKLSDKPLYFQSTYTAENLDRVYANHTREDMETTRLDAYNQLSYVTKLLGFLSVKPYAGNRQTFYTKVAGFEYDKIRNIWYMGIDTSTKFYRTFNVPDNWLGLDLHKLRHVITPSILYTYIREPSRNDLQPIDGIDTIVEKNAFTFALTNSLQTKRMINNAEETVDLARLYVKTDLNWRAQRGEDNYWPHKFSDIEGDLELRPFTWGYASFVGYYDPYRGYMRRLNSDYTIDGERWTASVGHRYTKDSNSQFEAQYQWTINQKWRFATLQRYEFSEKSWRERYFKVTRDLHSWEVDFIYERAERRAIWIVFRLKAFPDLFVPIQKSWSQPRTHYARQTW